MWLMSLLPSLCHSFPLRALLLVYASWPAMTHFVKPGGIYPSAGMDLLGLKTLDFLKGPPANTWLCMWCDCENTSSPLIFGEVWEQLQVHGSHLPEYHYHRMLKNFPCLRN